MNCRESEYAILEGRIGPEAQLHIQSCPSCRQFQAGQARIDALCTRAYRPPDLSRAFRRGLDAKLRREKAHGGWFVAPAVGLVCTTVCAWRVPDVWKLGVVLCLFAYVAPFAFEWLTEELGEA